MFKNIVVAIFLLAIFPGVVFSAGSCEGFQSGAIGGDWPNGRSAKLVINTIDDSNCPPMSNIFGVHIRRTLQDLIERKQL